MDSPFRTTTECVIDSYLFVEDRSPDLLLVRGQSSDPNCFLVGWIDVDGEFERFTALGSSDGSTLRAVTLFDGESAGKDLISISTIEGLELGLSRSNATDDRWLDIEFNFTP